MIRPDLVTCGNCKRIMGRDFGPARYKTRSVMTPMMVGDVSGPMGGEPVNPPLAEPSARDWDALADEWFGALRSREREREAKPVPDAFAHIKWGVEAERVKRKTAAPCVSPDAPIAYTRVVVGDYVYRSPRSFDDIRREWDIPSVVPEIAAIQRRQARERLIDRAVRAIFPATNLVGLGLVPAVRCQPEPWVSRIRAEFVRLSQETAQ